MYSFISCITKNIIFKSRMWDRTCSLISVMFRSAQKGRLTGWNGVNCQLTLLSGVELWAISFISAALDFPKEQWWACIFFYNKNVKFFWTKARMWVSSRSCPGSGDGPVEQRGWGAGTAHSLRLPGPSWAAAWSWDGAWNHIPSLPCPTGPSPLAWLRISLFQRNGQLLNEKLPD